ncbi:unnamed protein product [Hydatigera taeniaeformis]|uniref:MHD2 domain-containing protein n=1 Tax=Hydatigena taeniaeformis TaxID=6205 RepID=A0A0R3X7C4_HYDTA|nr:unnamed protein product [Hydatigera taeniaeformis]
MPYQCEVLTNCLETVQIYLHAGGRGLKRSFFQRSPELYNLQQALALYSQTTDALLKDYVTTEVFIMAVVLFLLLLDVFPVVAIFRNRKNQNLLTVYLSNVVFRAFPVSILLL